MDEEEKIQMVLSWAEDHPSFNTDFLHSLEDAISEYGSLTSAQDEALDNIIKRYRIKPKEEE